MARVTVSIAEVSRVSDLYVFLDLCELLGVDAEHPLMVSMTGAISVSTLSDSIPLPPRPCGDTGDFIPDSTETSKD